MSPSKNGNSVEACTARTERFTGLLARQLPALQAELDRAGVALDEMTITAPQDGVIESLDVRPGDDDHYENMWAEYLSGLGRVHEIVHLNETLAPYDCWISAVYHFARSPHAHHRVDVEGRLIRVDPLIRWIRDDVRQFMREHDLPFHPRAASRRAPPPRDEAPCPPTYHF